GLVLVALAIGAFSFKPTFNLASAGIPASAESQRALVTLQKGLPPGATDPTYVLLHSSSGPLSRAQLTSYGQQLKTLPGVGSVGTPGVSPDRATAEYQVQLSYDPQSDQALNAIKTSIAPGAHAHAPPGTYALVGGTSSVNADVQHAVNHDYTVVFPLASVGLGFAATLGASVLLFQVARHEAGLVFFLPVYMYLFVVALGTDYNILMIARLREEAR